MSGWHSECIIDAEDANSIKCLCVKENGFVESWEHPGSKCVQVVNELGSTPCEEHVQCKAGAPGSLSECSADSGNTCQCSEGSVEVPERNACVPKGSLGLSCEHSVQCSSSIPNSECSGSSGNLTCQCISPSYIPPPPPDATSFQECNKVAERLGDSCEGHPNQCGRLQGGGGITCNPLTKVCECDATTHVLGQDGSRCLPIADLLGDECEEDGQCGVEHSTCGMSSSGVSGRRKECLCEDHHVQSLLSPRKACLPVINELIQHCEEDIQCRSGTPGEFSHCADDGLSSSGNKVCRCACVQNLSCPAVGDSRTLGVGVEILEEQKHLNFGCTRTPRSQVFC